jgi:hypothetical protein
VKIKNIKTKKNPIIKALMNYLKHLYQGVISRFSQIIFDGSGASYTIISYP